MASFDFGGLFGGIKKGLERGIQQQAEFERMFVDAVRHGDTALLGELAKVAETWLGEAVTEAGAVKGNIVGQILGGADPFSGSRIAFQDVKRRHGK